MRPGTTIADDTVRNLADIFKRQPGVETPTMPPEVLALVREELGRDAPISAEGGGPAYCFPDSLSNWRGVIEITPANREVLRETFPGVHRYLESSPPCLVVLDAGVAVSVCFSARNGPRAAEAGVETREGFRGRGYGAAVTAAWGARIRAEGRIPLYSTWWGNTASQAVARRLDLRLFGTDATWD
jgi:hypothetical protein